MRLHKLGSSSDPTQVSLTVKGALTALIPLIIMLLKQYKVEITENEIADLITMISGGVAGVMILVGLIRKAWNSWKQMS